MKDMLREVKLALLEADVNYKIVKEFISNIQEKALGQDVMKSLKPGEQVVKIVRDELVELLGGTDSKINISSNPPTVILLVGLQGAGKTTMAGKLANYLRKQGKKPLCRLFAVCHRRQRALCHQQRTAKRARGGQLCFLGG